jgi:hypothetical protein
MYDAPARAGIAGMPGMSGSGGDRDPGPQQVAGIIEAALARSMEIYRA